MKTLTFALDLKNDPDIIAKYDEYHRDVWPEILKGAVASGVRSQRIFRTGNRLFMIVEVDEGYDWRAGFARYLEETPRAREWDALMRTFQQPVPSAGAGDWWTPMEEVYNLNEQHARLAAES